MAASSRILLNHNLKRCICTTTGNFSKYAMREGRFMKKMLSGDSGKRKWYVNKERPSSPIAPEKLTSNHVTRRMTVLNKLFMLHITDLMATGEAASELVGRTIEISHVKVTPDFRNVLVFWFSKIEGQHTATEKALNDCAYGLRHELTQLRVIGQVPLIKFVRNKQLAALDELEKRFKLADYGDDHQPILPTYVEKEELTLTTKLPEEVREQILQLKDTEQTVDEDDETEFDVDLPPMRHDVLALDHHAIMTRVKVSLSKSHEGAKHRLANVVTMIPNVTNCTIDQSSFQNFKNDAKAFSEFLVKRRLEDKLKLRREKRESVLSYHIRLKNYENNNDEDEFVNDEGDVDVFEDISLESLK